MWLSQQRRGEEQTAGADVGVVTLAGDRMGVYLDGERRTVARFGPGGYCWRPQVGQRVLVIKAGGEGELPCVAGVEQEEAAELEPGEVAVRSPGGGEIWLRSDGSVDLVGRVRLNGVPVEELFEPRRQESGGGSGGAEAE